MRKIEGACDKGEEDKGEEKLPARPDNSGVFDKKGQNK